MSEKKHTPGPWLFDEIGHREFAPNITTKDGNKLFDVRGWGYLTGSKGMKPEAATEEQGANGRLAAAAPDLLAACKEAERHHQGHHSAVGKMLRAAIAKAEGRS